MKLLDVSTRKYPDMFAMVDDDMFEELDAFKWSACERNGHIYVERGSAGGAVSFKYYLHRVISKAEKGRVVDHIDGNGLNNQKSNLRVCGQSQNTMNSKMRKNNTSGFKGVSWDKRKKKWEARIKVSGRHRVLGLFANASEAGKAYDDAAVKYFGDFAKTNQEMSA